MVAGGLSYKCERVLSERDAMEVEKLSDPIELKPSIYGVGVDLKELWRRWMRGKR